MVVPEERDGDASPAQVAQQLAHIPKRTRMLHVEAGAALRLDFGEDGGIAPQARHEFFFRHVVVPSEEVVALHLLVPHGLVRLAPHPLPA